MKIAISAQGKNLDSDISEVFGRSPYFIIAQIIDKKINSFEAIANPAIDQLNSAGSSAVQIIADNQAEAVISKNIGPRAFDALAQFNINIFQGQGTVKQAIADFLDNKLEKLN